MQASDSTPLLQQPTHNAPIPANDLARSSSTIHEESPIGHDGEEDEYELMKTLGLLAALLAVLFGAIMGAHYVDQVHRRMREPPKQPTIDLSDYFSHDHDPLPAYDPEQIAAMWKEHITDVGLFKPTKTTRTNPPRSKTIKL